MIFLKILSAIGSFAPLASGRKGLNILIIIKSWLCTDGCPPRRLPLLFLFLSTFLTKNMLICVCSLIPSLLKIADPHAYRNPEMP